MSLNKKNVDSGVVTGFGFEWEKFDQSALIPSEHESLFACYFSIFPWACLPADAVGFDMGCGSGRWAKLVIPRVGKLLCVDPSSALEVAKKNLNDFSGCVFVNAAVDDNWADDESMDFGYSLGVLHHIPDTQKGIEACAKKLKKGAPFLLYLYYDFDNKPFWYRFIWRLSDIARQLVSRLPSVPRYWVTQVISLFVYWPFSRIAFFIEKLGLKVANIPLSEYRNRSFYTMRTDALDRFGTRLERRFSREKITEMLQKAGFENIVFSESAPFWCAVGYKCANDC